ncbi:MAG: ATP-dependent Clp protease ATP-binding subunit ClpX, partial [Roseibacillus sp.]|nr:ATP-dependent Clp protease ATP-binding subunit ClpX [Roseibacillus sp.]
MKKLIAGPGVYICNECIEVCSTILEKEFAGEDQSDLDPAFAQGINTPTPVEIRQLLDEYVIGQDQAK